MKVLMKKSNFYYTLMLRFLTYFKINQQYCPLILNVLEDYQISFNHIYLIEVWPQIMDFFFETTIWPDLSNQN